MGLPSIGRFLDVLRAVDRLFENVKKLQDGQEILADRLLEVERRLAKREGREDLVVERIGNQAAEAARKIVTDNLFDLALTLGALEERTRPRGRATKHIA